MTRVMDFADHRRDLAANRHVYAVVSRRARGLSIGINLNADKVCNFDCPYCQVDRTTPGGPRAIDVSLLRAEFDHLLGLVRSGTLWTTPPFDTALASLRRVSDIAFAGDGEPTTAREWTAAARTVHAARGDLAVPIRLLTNATMLHRTRVREGLAFIDEVWCKLDAGTAGYFARVDGTTFPFATVLRNITALARERPVVLQCMFLAIDGVGPTEDEIDAWAGRIADIRAAGGIVDRVQVYTVARRPAQPNISALPMERLAAIAARAGGPAEVFGPG